MNDVTEHRSREVAVDDLHSAALARNIFALTMLGCVAFLAACFQVLAQQ